MRHTRARQIHHPPSGRGHTPAPIEILVVEAEPFIETAHLLKYCPPHQHTYRRNFIDIRNRVVIAPNDQVVIPAATAAPSRNIGQLRSQRREWPAGWLQTPIRV